MRPIYTMVSYSTIGIRKQIKNIHICIAINILSINRIVTAICVHVISQYPLTSTQILILVYKPPNLRIVVPAE